jgi:hypothetical protein
VLYQPGKTTERGTERPKAAPVAEFGAAHFGGGVRPCLHYRASRSTAFTRWSIRTRILTCSYLNASRTTKGWNPLRCPSLFFFPEGLDTAN